MKKIKPISWVGKIILAVVIFSVPLSGMAVSQYTGTTAAEFLNIGIGARQVGMGEAAVAACDDISSIYWNPAGLTGVKEKQFTFSHAFWIGESNHEMIGYCQPLKGIGIVGCGLSYLLYGNIIGMSDATSVPVNFSASDLAVIVSYATNLSRFINLGLNVKYIQQAIENEAGSAWALDAGFLVPNMLDGLNIGCEIRNIGFGLRVSESSSALPYSLRLGASYKMLENLLLSFDADISSSDAASIAVGAEYWQENVIAFRGGYNTRNIESLGGWAGLSFGIGFRNAVKILGYNDIINIDYAFVPYGDLVGTHRISTIFKF